MTGRAVLAFVLSAWQPGLGQLYAGRWRRAVLFLMAFVTAVALFLVGPLGGTFAGVVTFVLIAILIRLVAATDAGLLVRRGAERGSWYQRWYVCIPLGLVISVASTSLLAPVQRFNWYSVASGNMAPTLMPGDRILVDLAAYRKGEPLRGDIVVVASPEDPNMDVIHRVVAVEGDKVEIRDKALYVNGEETVEPWAVHEDPQVDSISSRRSGDWVRFVRDQMPPRIVPDDSVFLLGDNRDASHDSRFIGPFPLDLIRGSPLFVYWAADKSRIGSRLKTAPRAAKEQSQQH